MNQKYTTKKEEKQNNTMVEWSKTLSQFDKRLGQGGILLRWVKISLVVNLFGICLHICILKIKIKLPWNKRFTIKKKSIKKMKILRWKSCKRRKGVREKDLGPFWFVHMYKNNGFPYLQYNKQIAIKYINNNLINKSN